MLQRFANKIAKLGEQFTVGTNTYRGIFRILDSGTMRSYLNDTEIMGIVNPGLLLLTTPSTAITTDNTITRDGRVYYVLRSVVHKVGGIGVVRVVVLG